MLGAVLGPKVLGSLLRARERRRIDRLNAVVSARLRPSLAYFCGFFVPHLPRSPRCTTWRLVGYFLSIGCPKPMVLPSASAMLKSRMP